MISTLGLPSYLGTSLHASLLTSFFLSLLFPPQNDTLMWYLLDELHSYEEDYSDALAPTLREASALFAGEAALVRPASMEALHMAHVALTSDVAALHKTVVQVSASQDALAQDMRLIREALVPGSRTLASPQDMNGECISLAPC